MATLDPTSLQIMDTMEDMIFLKYFTSNDKLSIPPGEWASFPHQQWQWFLHSHTKFLYHMDQQGSWSARIPFTPLNTRATCQTKVTYSASHPCSPPSLDMLLPATALCTGTEITIVHSNKAFRISSGPAPEQVWDMQPPPVLTNTPPFFQCLIGPQPPTEDCCEKIS
jgi:hypothetical protein